MDAIPKVALDGEIDCPLVAVAKLARVRFYNEAFVVDTLHWPELTTRQALGVVSGHDPLARIIRMRVCPIPADSIEPWPHGSAARWVRRVGVEVGDRREMGISIWPVGQRVLASEFRPRYSQPNRYSPERGSSRWAETWLSNTKPFQIPVSRLATKRRTCAAIERGGIQAFNE